MPKYEVLVEMADGQYALDVEVSPGTPESEIRERAIAELNQAFPQGPQLTMGQAAVGEAINPVGLPQNRFWMPPQPTGAAEAFGTSVGSELLSLGTGARSLANLAAGDVQGRQQAQRVAGQLGEAQALSAEQFPVSTLAGGVAPYLALPGATAATLPRATATGGTIGAIRSGGDPMEAGIGAAGGLGGAALGKTAGHLLSRRRSRLEPFQQRALEQGQAMGLKVTPSQETGSRALQILESSLESNPLTSGAGQRITEANQKVLNRAAAEAIGEAGGIIDDVTLGNASRRIGSVISDVSKGVKARVDDAFLDALGDVEARVTGAIVRTDATQKVRDIITDLLEKRAVNDVLTGKQLTTYSSELKKAGRQLLRGEKLNPDLAFAYFGLAESLDDMLLRNLTKAGDKARLSQAREQWRNLTFLERPGAVRAGNVSPRVLSNVLARFAKGEYKRGGRQGIAGPTDRLFTAGRFGEAFPPIPSSGTAQRLAIPSIAGGVGAGSAVTGDLFTGMALGTAGPALLSRLYGRYPWVTGLAGLPAGTAGFMGGIGGRIGGPLATEIYRQP